MIDIRKSVDEKERILSIIKTIGPTYPNRISREARIQPLFAAAYLSELVSDDKLKLSSLRFGSSPLYFIPGQEPQLENFIEHLNSKEREAFSLLKQNQILEDEKLHPAIRVALRCIKDFAMPLIVNDRGQNKIFWKFFTILESEAKIKIQNIAEGIKPKAEKIELKKEEIEKPIIKETISEIKKEEVQITLKEEKAKLKKKTQKTKEKVIDTKFKDSIIEYLAAKDIEILQEILVDKKEFISKIRIDMPFGKQGFYLISKNKKAITTEDLAIALQKAQLEKMPAFFIAPGKPNKAAQEYLKEWKNLIKFEQVKL